jgi:hypothetical protein
MGGVQELRQRRQVLLNEARERGDLYAQTNLSTYIMALDRLGSGDPEGARVELQEAMSCWSQHGFHVQHHNAILGQTLIDLYSGNGATAWDRICHSLPAYKRSFLFRVQQVRIDILQSRARSALAAASADERVQRAMLRAARHDANRLGREKATWATALAEMIRGIVAWEQGNIIRAEAELRAAVTGFEATHMELFAAATRFRLGQLLDDSRKEELLQQAISTLESQRIQDPSRFVWMIAPVRAGSDV